MSGHGLCWPGPAARPLARPREASLPGGRFELSRAQRKVFPTRVRALQGGNNHSFINWELLGPKGPLRSLGSGISLLGGE